MSANDMVSRGQSQPAAGAEQTRTTLQFTPVVDIYETDEGLVLLADLPGVGKDKLSIDLKDDVLTITGEVPEPDFVGESLMAEFQAGGYIRQFTLGEAIDRTKIDAKLKNGVLTLRLPKAAKAKPHRIEVQPG